MHAALRLLSLLLCLLSGLATRPSAALEHSQSAPIPTSERTLVGNPAVSEDALFWFQKVEGQAHLAIYGYDERAATLRLITSTAGEARGLATDGTMLAWIERVGARGERIQGYTLDTGQSLTLVEPSPTASFGAIALDAGRLVYQHTAPEHRGLFMRDLVTGHEHLISEHGRNPVARRGMVLWSEEQMAAPYAPAQWTLHLIPNDGSGRARRLARVTGGFAGYDLSDDTVVWTAAAPATDRRVFVHQLSNGATRPVSDGPALFPAVRGDHVVWTDEPRGGLTAPLRWVVRAYRLEHGGTPLPIAESAGPIASWGLTRRGTIVLTSESQSSAAERTLRRLNLRRRGVSIPAAASPSSVAPHAACDAAIRCGQVRVRGYELADDAGRWPVSGVQFFLPQYGINTWTFHDQNYAAATADVDRWLDVARDELAARTLRIFVELPSGSTTPTSHATLYDFARRANARGMRLGVVIQNSSDFRMTAERRFWLSGLLDYFTDRDASDLLAYISAANEINNWCDRRDCFDNNPAYLDAAIEWVAQVVDVVKPSGILTTVGMATEVADMDGRPAWHNFHRPDRLGRSLADLVDFVAPHNYGGGAYAIIHDLRYELGYQGPVVLEEYGFPTDPERRDERYREGPSVCRSDPWHATCVDTAPYFVEWSTRAMRETSYAGGVAWMLADITAKRCSTDPPDLWTGLFAAGYGYCGGTTTTTTAQPKATAHRVKLQHLYRPPEHQRFYMPLIGR